MIQVILWRASSKPLKQSVDAILGPYDECGNAPESKISWPREITYYLVGKAVLQLACYSDALYDHRIFQISLWAMVTLIMALLHLHLTPRLPSDAVWDEAPSVNRWLGYLRPIVIASYCDSREFYVFKRYFEQAWAIQLL